MTRLRNQPRSIPNWRPRPPQRPSVSKSSLLPQHAGRRTRVAILLPLVPRHPLVRSPTGISKTPRERGFPGGGRYWARSSLQIRHFPVGPSQHRSSTGSHESHGFGDIAREMSHTSVMASGLRVGGDVEQALENVGVPSYVLDKTGVVRWINPAAEQLLGDIRGRHFTSVVAPEESRRARELILPEGARHLPGQRGDRLPGLDRRHAGGRGGQRGGAQKR